MGIARKLRRFLRMDLRGVLLLVAVLAILCAVAVPRLRERWQVVDLERRNLARAEATVFLQSAVERDDLVAARRALLNGGNPDAIAGQWSLLRHCIDRGQISMMNVLLKSGGRTDRVEQIKDGLSGPPLWAAILSSHPTEERLRMVSALIAADPQWQQRYDDRTATSIFLRQPDGAIVDLLREHGATYGPPEVVALGRIGELRALVEKEPNLVRKHFDTPLDHDPQTLLNIALLTKQEEVATFLLERGVPLTTRLGTTEQTALHLAAIAGFADLIPRLISGGLDVDVRDRYGDTPLIDSASVATPSVVAALLDAGAEVDARGLRGRTALHTVVRSLERSDDPAALSNRMKLIALLISAGADPTIEDLEGESALGWAAANKPELVEHLQPNGP